MRHSQTYIVVLLVGALATTAVLAQEKKLYRWVDKQGIVHYDDALPPEAVNQARQVLNAKTGSITDMVDRALTPEERAQQAAEQKRLAELADQAKEKMRTEEAMLASYQTADDLRRAYEERVSLLKQTLESTDASLKSLRFTIITLLAEASEDELSNRSVNPKHADTLRELHAELLKQQALQSTRQAELTVLESEFQGMLARFSALRTTIPATTTTPPDAGASTTTPPTPPPAPTPKPPAH